MVRMSQRTPAKPRGHGLAATTLALASLGGCLAAPPVAPEAPAASGAGSAAAPGASGASGASSESAQQQAFARWLEAFGAFARAQGIREETLRVAFADVRYVPRVVDRDRAQPELTRTVWDYLDRTVTPQRVSAGQEKLLQVRGEADGAAARFGVPPHVVLAVWAMESNYGGNVGDVPTVDALATLGFEGRREAWARGELLAALKIVQAGDIEPARMTGSWAGAMGQTQFLPSSYLAYAVDADGDGRRDIWGSAADVLASMANFLARAGWQADQPWGVEVRLPPAFDHARADLQVRQPSARWSAEGVQSTDGAALPEFGDGAILLPAGARGPAFLVGPNFRAFLRYNNSSHYALAVGLLAQRLGGGPGVTAAWPRDLAALTRTQLMALQTALNERGFDSGTPDGMVGTATRSAIRRYQRSVGLPADGYPTLELLQRLQAP
ncbi:MAG: lytic murein transglycosylase [Burkholderiales bacterium]|nr:lytic murein transglycosylase [Burkholderiales bacterium]